MNWRPLIYIANLIFIGIVPLICYALSTQAGHSAVYLSTISANYMHFPARLVFLLGTGVFVIIHYASTKLISPRLVTNKKLTVFTARLEMLILSVFFTIAAIPAHVILGLHATLAGLLAGATLLWMHTVIEETFKGQLIDWVRQSLYIASCCLAFGMVVSYPHQIIYELGATRADMAKRLHLLGLDDRWFVFAHFEWVYFYCVLLFFATLVSGLLHKKQKRNRQRAKR